MSDTPSINSILADLRAHAKRNGDAALQKRVRQLNETLSSAGGSISVGDISGSTAVAIGEDIQIIVNQNTNLPADLLAQLTALADALNQRAGSTLVGSAPPLPQLVIGREDVLGDLKTLLGIGKQVSTNTQASVVVHGWPGVGKTTVAAALCHDPEILAAYEDGILWASLGITPDLFFELAAWGRALGTNDLMFKTIEESSERLAALLRNKRLFLVVDDVWEPEHATLFRVGGRGCAMLITTRESKVAQTLAHTADHIYKLDVLTDEKALELLQKLAPTVVEKYPQSSLELVQEFEGLPLAIDVAGHMLNAEAASGFDVNDLLADIREGARLLEAQSPAGRIGAAGETLFSVAALFQKSTDRLDAHIRECFAYLGVFAPKPATFDLAAMKAVWNVEDPKPTVRILVERGLLQFLPDKERYWMHSLLVKHASSLVTED